MTWLVMLLVGATPTVSYGLACVGDSSAMRMTEQPRHHAPELHQAAESLHGSEGHHGPQAHHESQHHHSMPCHGQCPDLDDGARAPRLTHQDGEPFPPMPAGAMTCCIVTSSVTGPFAASSTKHEASEADAESEPPAPDLLPPQSVTRHPRVTAGPPPIVISGARAGTRTFLTTSRLRL